MRYVSALTLALLLICRLTLATAAESDVTFGTTQPDVERIGTITVELEKRRIEDQAVRKDPARAGEMQKIDGNNTAYLRSLIKEIGWIDAARFGVVASATAFLIVQHSDDLPLMQAVLPEIEKDVKAKLMPDGQTYALLYDRVQLLLGKKQRYGSQITQNAKGEMYVPDLEDKKNVDRRRAEMGMGPLGEYLEYFKKQNGGKPVEILGE